MINLKDFIGNSGLFRKFKVDDLLFAEFLCPPEESGKRAWWDNNFFAYIIGGETLLRTPQQEITLKEGDCVFVKKGSVLSQHLSQEDFCELLVFVSDEFIKRVAQKYSVPIHMEKNTGQRNMIINLEADEVLHAYFHSLLSYFYQSPPPGTTLLKLKFEELLINIFSGRKHLPLKSYFAGLCYRSKPSIQEIMEANFVSNLSLNDFARLCTRSLSTFKRDFVGIYHTSPGKWLQSKRLEYATYLLRNSDYTLDEICLLSGFENKSHFTQVFKLEYSLTPGKYRLNKTL